MGASAFENLSVEEHGDVLVVRIDRPPANALSPELLEEGARLANELGDDPPAAIVLTGSGRFFSGGMDLKLAPTLSGAQQARVVNGINALFSSWYALPRPVVAAVNGHAVAGGLILALCADLRVCALGLNLGLTEARVGLPYPAAAMAVAKAELAPATARRLILEAALIDSDTALRMGVVDELVATDRVLPRALELARELGGHPARAYEQVKHQLRGATIARMRAAIEADPMIDSWAGDETAAAADAVLRRSHD